MYFFWNSGLKPIIYFKMNGKNVKHIVLKIIVELQRTIIIYKLNLAIEGLF